MTAQILDPDLAYKIQEVTKRLERRRRASAWLRFSLCTLLAVCSGTVALSFSGSGAVSNLILLVFVVVEAAAFRIWLRPLYKNPISEEQVALFIDEHHPELQNRIVSLVSLSEVARGHDNSWLIRRFLKESQSFVRQSAFSYNDRLKLRTPQPLLVPLLLVATALIVLRFGDLWIPRLQFDHTGVAQDYEITPGDARVQMGDDVTIFVTSNVGARAVGLQWRVSNGAWEEVPMHLGQAKNVYFYLLPGIHEETRYRVQFGTELSRTYKLTPWVPPEVLAMDLVYHFPKYLARDPRVVPNAGDISAIEGTRVEITAEVNKDLEKLEMVLESGLRVPFTLLEDERWQAFYTVEQDDQFTLNPVDFDGAEARYKPSYRITAKPDKAPRISVDFPFRDMEVSPLEEVGFEFKVSDDFGLADFGIRYHVADRDPVDVSLMKRDQKEALSASAYHQLMLEEMNLKPGDLLTWTVWAKDHKPGRDEFNQMGDPFFLEIRPFKRLFRQAVSNENNGQGGGGDLIKKQKQVMIATWNLRKDTVRLSPEAFTERLDVIRESEAAVLEAVTGPMASMMADRPEYKLLVSALESAVDQLEAAADQAEAVKRLSQAAVFEQKAYRHLLQMMPDESQVSRNRGQNGASSGRQMAGMNDLEMQRNRNFYEEERRTKAQQEAAAEALDKIKDLAQRQKMINQEIAKLISELEQEVADEREVQRRLERLKEEARKNLEELDKIHNEISNSEMDADTAKKSQKQLDQVRERMNRGLESMRPESLQQARAAGGEATRDLDELEEELERKTRGSAEERMADLAEQMAELRAGQARIQEQIDKLETEKDSPRLTAEDPSQVRKTELLEEKQEQAKRFREIMEDAASVSAMTRGDQEHLSRQLGDWLRKTSREGIGEDMEEASALARFGVWDELAEKEARIAEKIDKVAEGLIRVAQQMAGDELEAKRQALAELQALQEKVPNMPGNPGQGEKRSPEGSREENGREGKEDGKGEKGGNQQGEARQGEARQAQAGQSGPGSGGPGSGDKSAEMENLVGNDYRDWLERLRNAEGLLGESRHRQDLTRMRREIEKMRRRYKRDQLVPKFEMFVNSVLNPLNQTAAALQEEVQAIAENRKFVLADDGSIPEGYRKQVADYFQVLSESEGN